MIYFRQKQKTHAEQNGGDKEERYTGIGLKCEDCFIYMFYIFFYFVCLF